MIKGNTELLIRRLAVDSPMQRNLGQVRKAADRAAALVDQLLAFSRKQFAAPRVLDLNVAARDLERMLRPLIGEDIELVVQSGTAPAHVKMDPVQLEQIVLNLAVNARDAMPSGGRLGISVETVASSAAGGENGVPWVTLSITDTGIGMTEEVREHIFEPFFTTKEVGKGTGLGLATVYGLVQHAGGMIHLETAPGKGSTFVVRLPAAEPSTATETAQAEAEAPRRGKETVLVVEDEELVRAIVCETLSEHGYTVIEALSPELALDTVRRYAGPIHLLLTDMVMPRMNGGELAGKLRALQPAMKVVCISGYTNQSLPAGARFLQKPFTPNELVRIIAAALDERDDGSQGLLRLQDALKPAAAPAPAS